jgi:hypothetical protein
MSDHPSHIVRVSKSAGGGDAVIVRGEPKPPK